MAESPPKAETNDGILHTRVGIATYLAPSTTLSDEGMQVSLLQKVNDCIALHETQIYVDFTNVSAMNSSALEIVLSCHDQLMLTNGQLHLINVNAIVNEVFSMTGLNHFIDVANGIDDHHEHSFNNERKRLGDMLVSKGLLTADQVDKAIVIQSNSSKRIGEIAIDKGWVTESDMLRIMGEQLGIPFINLRVGLFDIALQSLLPIGVLRRLKMVPLFKLRGQLFVATSEPHAIPAHDEVYNLTGLNVVPILTSSDDLAAHMEQASHQEDYDITSYISDMENDLEVVENTVEEDYNVIDEMASGSPIINLVNAVIQRAIRDGASDVHIEPSRKMSRVRFRIDGILYEFMTQPADMHPAIVSRLKVMANLDIAERRLPQDGRVQVNTQGRSIDLRFSSLPGIFGEKIVLRVLDKNQNILDIERLGLQENNLALLKKLLSHSHGLILATGPTGSGKTTSLYAAINYLNTIEKSIVTIEDPVEYQIEIINQNQVNDKVGLSFSRVLRHVLRQDPDIVMVGEIRDKETAQIAVQAALTGHLVLSTLHTNESAGAITRLIEMGIEPYLLSSALIGVVAQRLIRTICPDCKTNYIASPDLVEKFGWQDKEQVRLSKGRGCSNCYDSGYKGRMAVHEILECDASLQQLMTQSPSREQLTLHMKSSNVKTLFDDGLQRVLDGKTTLDEVSRVLMTD